MNKTIRLVFIVRNRGAFPPAHYFFWYEQYFGLHHLCSEFLSVGGKKKNYLTIPFISDVNGNMEEFVILRFGARLSCKSLATKLIYGKTYNRLHNGAIPVNPMFQSICG